MNFFKNNNNFFAIGDVANEYFIEIENANVLFNKESNDSSVCFPYGGKVPYESLKECKGVGNSANFAIGATRLGLPVSLISYVGDDFVGTQIIEKFKKEKINIKNIKKISGVSSNIHFVLNFKGEKTIFVKHSDFPYSLPKDIKADWIYLSSLSSNSILYHKQILDYLNLNKNTKLIFQPGTFQIKLGLESLLGIYQNTYLFISNKEEAERILNIDEMDVSALLEKIHDLGPKNVLITDSINGAYFFDGKEKFFMNSLYKKEETIESTGAGDSFSAGFVSAIYFGKNIKEALSWGAINAKEVVSFVGPHDGLLDQKQILQKMESFKDSLILNKIN